MKKKYGTVTLYVKDRKLYHNALKLAHNQGKSFSEVVEELVRRWVIVSDLCCDDEHDGFICTKAKNHKGLHTAHVDDGVIVSTWT